MTCCTGGDCCGPGSYCCANTGPHEHHEEDFDIPGLVGELENASGELDPRSRESAAIRKAAALFARLANRNTGGS